MHRDPYKTLKATVDRQILDLGGVNEVSRRTGIGTDRLSRYSSLSAQNAGTHINLAALHDLESLAVIRGAEPIVLIALADLLDRDVVPRRIDVKPANYDTHATDVTRASCAMLVALQEARADGGISEDELVGLDELASRMQQELAEFRADVARDLGRNVTTLRTA